MNIKLTLLLLFLPCCMFAQAPAIGWQTTLGCTYTNPVSTFIVDNQGNYVCAGQSSDSCEMTGHNFGRMDGWIIKTDTLGNRLWSVVLGADSADNFLKIIQTADSGYVAVGSTQSQIASDIKRGFFDWWIVKLDINGNLLWQRALGSPQYDVAYDVVETQTGELLVAGYVGQGGGDVTLYHGGALDGWIIKLDPAGNLLWEKTYGSTGGDAISAIKRTADNNYIVTGMASAANGNIPYLHSTSLQNDAWVMKLNDTGGVMWSKTYGGSLDQMGQNIIQTNDGGYLVGAATSSADQDVSANYGDYDLWALKLDDTGKIQWQHSYGGSNADNFFTSVTESMEGGYLFTGTSVSVDHDAVANHGSSDILVIKTGNTGNVVWSRMCGGSSGEAAATAMQQADSTYVIGATTNSHNGDVMAHTGNTNGWIFRLQKYHPSGINPATACNNIKVFPTITDDRVTVELPAGNNAALFELYDITGRMIHVPIIDQGNSYILSLYGIMRGMYLLRFSYDGYVHTFKIIKAGE